MKDCPSQIDSLVFLCTAVTADHESKKYLLDECPILEEIHITEKTRDGGMAEAIYDKLEETNYLNKLRQYGDSRKECVQYIKQVNDIIDVLYIAQEGRGFITYFSGWLEDKEEGEEKDAFLYLNTLFRLGIHTISRPAFSNLLIRCGIKIEMRAFLKNYRDIIQFDGDDLSLRCSRLLWDSVKARLNDKTILYQLVNSAKHIAKSLREGDETIENAMFQKLIKANNLYRKLGLSYNVISNMLFQLEKDCKHLSYYWVQRGIANREIEKFEEANNAFTEAASIRNNTSFHIRHAQAKNYMQWGLWANDYQPGVAFEFFERGREQMKELILNAPTRYYAYSVHTYVDMVLRNHRKSGFIINWDELSILLQRLLAEHTDKLNEQITRKFLSFCKDENIESSTIDDLRALYKAKFPNSMLRANSSFIFDSDDLAD